MKHLIYILAAVLFAGCTTTRPGQTSEKNTPMVHSVFFRLQHGPGSFEEAAFFSKAKKLAVIPGVQNFQVLREVSPKNPYIYGFSMQFASQADYDGYNAHPDHVDFVQDVWVKEVLEFQEIDYVVAN